MTAVDLCAAIRAIGVAYWAVLDTGSVVSLTLQVPCADGTFARVVGEGSDIVAALANARSKVAVPC